MTTIARAVGRSSGGLHPPPQGQTGRAIGADNNVVEQPNLHQLQRLLDADGDGAVGGGGLRVAARMVVKGDDRRGIQQERPLHDFARVDFRAVHGAEEQVFDRQDGVPDVEEDAAEDFPVPVSAVGAEERCGGGRVGERAQPIQLAAQDALGGFQDLLVSVGPFQPQVVRFHGEVSRGGSASWSRPSAPPDRLRTHERARVRARSGGRNGSRAKRPWQAPPRPAQRESMK